MRKLSYITTKDDHCVRFLSFMKVSVCAELSGITNRVRINQKTHSVKMNMSYSSQPGTNEVCSDENLNSSGGSTFLCNFISSSHVLLVEL